jgi:hypothetical protein
VLRIRRFPSLGVFLSAYLGYLGEASLRFDLSGLFAESGGLAAPAWSSTLTSRGMISRDTGRRVYTRAGASLRQSLLVTLLLARATRGSLGLLNPINAHTTLICSVKLRCARPDPSPVSHPPSRSSANFSRPRQQPPRRESSSSRNSRCTR